MSRLQSTAWIVVVFYMISLLVPMAAEAQGLPILDTIRSTQQPTESTVSSQEDTLSDTGGETVEDEKQSPLSRFSKIPFLAFLFRHAGQGRPER